MIFILLDNVEVDSDKRIAEHVIRMHRYRPDSESHGEPIRFESCSNFFISSRHSLPGSGDCSENIFEDYNELLHGNQILSGDNRLFSPTFFAKYLQVARALKPSLTLAACDLISTEYTRLRTQDFTQYNIAKTQPVTARTLESLIRLSTAHAKSRINKKVESVDVYAAISMINFAYFKELSIKNKINTNEINEIMFSDNTERSPLSLNLSSIPKHQEVAIPDFPISEQSEMLFNISSKQDFVKFKELVFRAFSNAHTDLMKVDELLLAINNAIPGIFYTLETLLDYLSKMQEYNQIMVSDEMVYLI